MTTNQDLFVLLHSTMKKMRKIAEKELVPFGIGYAEMRILMIIYFYYAEGCGQEEIIAHLELDRSNVGRALKKLEQLQYVTRVKNEKDRRGYRVSLTEKGRAVREQLLAIRQNIQGSFTLAMTDHDVTLLSSLLKQADQSLNEENYRSLKTHFSTSHGATESTEQNL